MKCKKCKKWLLLYRAGELSPRQREKLHIHMQQCPSCQAKQEVMEEYHELLKQAKHEPHLPHPQVLTAAIMQSVHSQSAREQRLSTLPTKTKFLTNHPARFSLAGLLIIVIGVFVLQEILILKRLHHLERRMKTQEQRTISAQDDILIRLLRSELESGNEDKILVDRQTFLQLLSAVAHNTSPAKIEKLLLSEPLELQNITFSNGLDRSEIAALLAHRQDILKKLKKL